MKNHYFYWFRLRACVPRKTLLSMRFVIVLLTIGLSQGQANSYAQRITISEKNAPLEKVIKTIRIQSGYDILGDASLIKEANPININVKNATVEEALNACFAGSNIRYSIDNKIVALRLEKSSSPRVSAAQTDKITVTGKVVDEKGQALSGASIHVKGGGQSVQTERDGTFRLAAVDRNAVLTISYVSYKAVELKAKEQLGNITLLLDDSTLDEVSVTVSAGYGTIKRRDVTDAVTSLNPKTLEASTAISIGNIIQGQLPGVQVITGSSSPGAPVRIRIRGDASLGNGVDPLVVVDGVPMPSDFDLNDINPNDIQALDVLKGASATAIYGSRASAGVLEIRTKRGTAYTKPQISYSYNLGVKALEKKVKSLNADQFKDLFEEGLINYIAGGYNVRGGDEAVKAFTSPTSGVNIYERYLPDDKFGSANTDWVDLMIGRATSQTHHLSLRGGDKRSQYSFSYGKNKDDGMLVGSNFDRNTLNMNYDQNFSDYVKVGFSLMGTTDETNGTVSIGTATGMRPDIPVYNEDGSYHIFSYDFNGTRYYLDNPLILANDVTKRRTGKVLNISPYAEFKFLKDFKFTTRYNYYYNQGAGKEYYPRTTQVGKNYSNATGVLQDNHNSGLNTTFTNYLSYLKTVGEHDITAVLGTEFNTSKNEYVNERYMNFADDKIQNAVWQAAKYQSASGDVTETAAIGYYGRLNYKFKDRYLLTSSFRVDGSSRFAPANRYGFFPAVSAAYIISDEPFFETIKNTVDLLKFRASAGKTGNDRVGAYSWLPKYQSGVSYMDLPGVRPTDLGNDNLKWESTSEYNVGLDFGFMANSRIRGSIDIYKKNINNMLIGIPMAPSTGVVSVYQNFGNMSNKGVELGLSGVVVQRDNFTWELGANISKNSNKLTKLGVDRASATSGATWLTHYVIEEGQPMGLVYGYKTDGFFQSWEEVDRYEALNSERRYQETNFYSMPGDIKFVDVSGDGYISSGTGKDDDIHEDRRVIGKTQPSFYGGFNSSLQYKGLRLDITGTFQKGGVKYWKYGENQLQMSYISPNNVDALALERWTPENRNAKYPLMRHSYYTNKINDFWLYDASFLKIQEINLSYYIPKEILQKTKIISGLNVFASVSNVITFTKYPGYNVESFSSNPLEGSMMDNSAYPNERTFKVGARIMF